MKPIVRCIGRDEGLIILINNTPCVLWEASNQCDESLTLAPLQTLRHCGLNNATLHDYHYEVFFSVNFWWGTSGETSLRAERTLTTRKHIALTNHITVAGWESRNCLSPAHLCQYNTFQRTSTSKNSTFFLLIVWYWILKLEDEPCLDE